MEKQKDITDLTETEAKAIIYDRLCLIENAKLDIEALKRELARKASLAAPSSCCGGKPCGEEAKAK